VLTLPDLRVTFPVYHVGVCLLLPLGHSLAAGIGQAGHRRLLGLVRPSPGAVREGLLTGALLGGGVAAAAEWGGSALVDPGRVAATLAGWGVDPGRDAWLAAVMVAANAPAEELFWRGWLHGRLAGLRPRRTALALTTLGYASYHAVTLRALLPSAGVAAAAFAGVLLLGGWWAWRRERRGDVWTPLLGHAGATAGYMAAYLLHVS
jgi:hypothetical protein